MRSVLRGGASRPRPAGRSRRPSRPSPRGLLSRRPSREVSRRATSPRSPAARGPSPRRLRGPEAGPVRSGMPASRGRRSPVSPAAEPGGTARRRRRLREPRRPASRFHARRFLARTCPRVAGDLCRSRSSRPAAAARPCRPGPRRTARRVFGCLRIGSCRGRRHTVARFRLHGAIRRAVGVWRWSRDRRPATSPAPIAQPQDGPRARRVLRSTRRSQPRRRRRGPPAHWFLVPRDRSRIRRKPPPLLASSGVGACGGAARRRARGPPSLARRGRSSPDPCRPPG